MSDDRAAGTNGGAAARDVKLDTLILTYDRGRDHLEIGGYVNSTDLMLDILARATRQVEARWRMEQIRAVQQAAADATLSQRIGLAGHRG